MGKEDGRGMQISRREILKLGAVAGAGVLLTGASGVETFPNNNERFGYIADLLPQQHKVRVLCPSQFHRGEQVQKAVDFILRHQLPNGAILTDFTKRQLTVMDMAHAGMGLVQAGYVEQAKDAIRWSLAHLTPHEESPKTILVNGQKKEFSFGGSWYNEYNEHGKPMPNTAQGRNEQNGLTGMTIDAICQIDPSFFTSTVAGKPVSEHVWGMFQFVKQNQQPNGTIFHSPMYAQAFPEENVRVYEGARLMAQRFLDIGDVPKAYELKKMADRIEAALKKNEGFSYGMSYDYIAQAMWGVGGKSTAEREVRQGLTAGKITRRGVKMYDMKQDRISYFDREKWKQKWGGEIYEVAGSLEGAQAFLKAGWIDEAEEYEKNIAALQRPDGGFPTGFFGPFSGGSETIFTAGRFILLERQMTDVLTLKNQNFLIGKR